MTEPFIIRTGPPPQPEFKRPPANQDDDILARLRDLERRIQLLESQAGTT